MVNIGVDKVSDPSAHANAKLVTNGIVNANGLILPNKFPKIDENSNCDDASNVQNTFNSCTNEVCEDCSCNNVDHDDVNKVDDGTVHNCQCNKMLSTYTKLLKNVGKSFR